MLTFNALRAANIARIPLFRDANGKLCHNHDGSDWSASDWMMALVGELGELANFLKKVKRGDYSEHDDGVMTHVAKEMADVQIYLDILAFRLGVDLGRATLEKFNEVSERVKCDVRIESRSLVAFVRYSTEMMEPAEFTLVNEPRTGDGWVPLYR